MGPLASKFKESAVEARTEVQKNVQSAVIRSKLVDMKQMKVKRDTEIAMRMAVLRDRVHWLLLFYGTMVGANAFRLRRFGIKDKSLAIGRFEPLPFAYIPYVAVPFLFLYQFDFAYLNKSERLNIEAQKIMRMESHWFNKPIVLPRYLEGEYRQMMRDTNKQLAELGEPAEKDWAAFVDHLDDEQVLEGSSPLSRCLHPILA